jgi:hypothetical protein
METSNPIEGITLKQLAPYLPYGVDSRDQSNRIYRPKLQVNNINTFLDGSQIMLLHPLSDLTKEIEVNGERFVPIHVLDEIGKPIKHSSPSVCFTDGYVEMEYWNEYNKLFEWHFDVFDLISKGLAININYIQK